MCRRKVSARYDSRGNGPAEAGVKTVKDKGRTLISAATASCGSTGTIVFDASCDTVGR